MVSKGATTSWERWDTDTQDGGMNGESQKILSGNLEAWLYQTLGGINYDPDPSRLQAHHFAPPSGRRPDLRPGLAHDSLRPGRQRLEDRRGEFLWTIAVPPNTTATVYVPAKEVTRVTEGGEPAGQARGVKLLRTEAGAAVYSVGSGTYSFRSF